MLYKYIIFLIIFLGTPLISWSQNDTIVLKNKDKIVGEIKSMDRGIVTIETDYSDSDFTITWIDIISIKSRQTYLITLSDGTRINSSMYTEEDDSGLVTLIGHNNEKVEINDIVYINPVKKKFISRIKASVSLGYNVTKSNNLSQLSIISDLRYTTYKWTFYGNYNEVRSNQDNVDVTSRVDASVGLKYFMRRDWFFALSGDFLSNDEQKLKLRSTTKGGLGKYIVHSNRMNFGGGFGLAFNNEKFTDVNNTNRNSLEAYVGLALDIFDAKDFNLNTNLTFYPSLTEGGRYRADYNLNLKYDLPLEFFIKLGLAYNYDSKPVEGASVSDYVFQSTFGWEFN